MDSLFPIFGSSLSLCGKIEWSISGIGSGSGCMPGCNGYWVMMHPSVFLMLATPLAQPRPSLEWIHSQISAGYPMCPPSLDVIDFARGRPPAVLRHDGRHRTMAAAEVCGDSPIPVRVYIRGGHSGLGSRSVLARARVGLKSQRGIRFVGGPIFGEDIAEDGTITTGVPPPGRLGLNTVLKLGCPPANIKETCHPRGRGTCRHVSHRFSASACFCAVTFPSS
jgi:hypothetical protein